MAMGEPTDERLLPAMYMVWPIHRFPTAPLEAIPGGYAVRKCSQPDLGSVRRLIDADEPISDRVWESFLDRIVPGGVFLIDHSESRTPVATASAVHNPRATRYYFPFGGEVGYVTVDPTHRGKGLGAAVVARVVGRLIEAGYRHIFVGVQGWRLPAVKCYLKLGFVPLLHNDELLMRWRRVCERIGCSVNETEWPRSLPFAIEQRDPINHVLPRCQME
jgi:mycothiol synthase